MSLFKNSKSLFVIVFLFLTCLMNADLSGQSTGGRELKRPTGAVRPDANLLRWEAKHMKQTKSVLMNRIGLERINKHRKAKGEKQLSAKKVKLAPIGQEIVTGGDLRNLEIQGRWHRPVYQPVLTIVP